MFCSLLFLKKVSFWEYSFIVNKHNQTPTDIFNKQDVTLKDLNELNFRLQIPEAIFEVFKMKHQFKIYTLQITMQTYMQLIILILIGLI